ncbi:MAG TPA: hypothetical protein DCS93_20240 [Microscillaceae bacterium]|nr:hypothetical protein [Microscillaceae bacterium]
MHTLRNIILSQALLLLHITCIAQTLDFKSYLALVKQKNLDLKQVKSQIYLSALDARIVKSSLLPQVNANAIYQRDFNKNFLFFNDPFLGSSRIRTNFNNSIGVSVEAQQVLFDARVFSGLKTVKLTKELSELSYQDAHHELIAQASQFYWQAIFIKESIQVLEQNKALAKEQVNQLQLLNAKGVISTLTLNEAVIQYKKTLPLLTNAMNQYQLLLHELKKLANIPQEQTLTLTENLTQPIISQPIASAQMLENQSQVKVLNKQMEIANQTLVGEKRNWMPSLSLNLGFDYNGADNAFKFNNNSNRLFYGRLLLNIPIYSGGQKRAEIQKAIITRNTLASNIQNVKQGLLKEIKNAQSNVLAASQKITIHQEIVSLNEKQIEIFRKRLKLGEVTPLEFKESRLQLTQSKLEILNAYLDLRLAEAQLRRILSTPSN